MKSLRTTVVGSFPRRVRPADTLKKPALSRAEADDLIRWAVEQQVATGLDVVTDGEGRRENMYYFFHRRMDGFSFERMTYRRYGDTGFGIEVPHCIGPVGNPRCGLAHDWRLARSVAPPNVEVKLTCTGPHMLAKYSVNEHYASDRELAFAIADALNAELREAVRTGCECIQFDEPGWTAFPEDVPWAVEALNRASRDLGVRVGLHVCGGNPRRKRVFFARYQDLIDGFRRARIDQVVLEYATLEYDMLPFIEAWGFRGEWALGVVDQRSDAIEPAAEVAARARRALAYIPPQRLLLTSECGFGHVPFEITVGKIRALTAGAEMLRAEL